MHETGDNFKDMEASTTAASKYSHRAKKLASTALTHFSLVTNAINWWKPSQARLGNPGASRGLSLHCNEESGGKQTPRSFLSEVGIPDGRALMGRARWGRTPSFFFVAEIPGKWLPRVWPCLWTAWLRSKGPRWHAWGPLTLCQLGT